METDATAVADTVEDMLAAENERLMAFVAALQERIYSLEQQLVETRANHLAENPEAVRAMLGG